MLSNLFKIIFLIFISLLFVSPCSSRPVLHKVSSNNSIGRLVPSVIKITVLTSDSIPIGGGTGVVIDYLKKDNKSIILTNAHICNILLKDKSLSLGGYVQDDKRDYISNKHKSFSLSIVDISSDQDLCLLSSNIKILKVNVYDKLIKPSKEVFVIGGPNGNFPIIISTYVSGYILRGNIFEDDPPLDEFDVLMLSMTTEPGHSGSPIFSKKGDLVGIVFGNLNRSIHTYFGPESIEIYGTLCISSPEINLYLSSISYKQDS